MHVSIRFVCEQLYATTLCLFLWLPLRGQIQPMTQQSNIFLRSHYTRLNRTVIAVTA